MKLRQRILTTTSITLLLFAFAIGIALFGMVSTQDRFQRFIDVDQALLQEETNMYAQGLQMGQALRNIVMDPNNEAAYKNIATAAEAFTASLNKARNIAVDDPATLQLLASVGSIRERHIKEQEHVISAINNQQLALASIRQRETPVWREMRTLLLDSIAQRQRAVQTASAEMQSFTAKIVIFSIITGLLGLIATSGLMYWLGRGLLQQMGGEPDEALRIANAIADGDFTQAVQLAPNDKHSLLATMSRMQQTLITVASNILAASERIDTASNEIRQGNEDLSARTQSQAAGLEQTAAAMEEITSTVRLNADNATEGNQVASRASSMATQSGSAADSAVRTMNEIRDSSERMVEIISTIESIAFQTNILALNAAVEAARAGEQGRGFAVVASEVRNLAQRSGAAAADIKQLIDTSVERIAVGDKQITVAGDAVLGLTQAIKDVALIMDEITSASQEQTIGINEIGQAVLQIDDTTQQNAALVQEATAAAHSLTEQSARLREMASQFKMPSQQGQNRLLLG